MIRFQVEKWSECLPEIRPIAHLLWEDVAIDKDRFEAKIGEQRYAELEKIGMLHLVTARDGKKLAGIYLVFLTPNAHYDGQGLMAFTDAYYLLPEYRTGNIGMKMFAFAEARWKEKGCVKAYTSHKIHRDRSKMLKELGWTASDIIYSKVIG